MARFAGSAIVKVNGQLCKTVQDSVELMVGGMQREAQMADNTFNYKQRPMPANLKVKFLHTPTFPFKMVNELADGIVEVEFDTGDKYDIQGAVRMGDPIMSTVSDGQITAEFGGTVTLK